MAKGKYAPWLEPDNIAKIENWSANGLTDSEIAKNIGISRQTLYVWYRDHQDIYDAVKRGRMMSACVIENALFKSAVGEVWEESEITEINERDGVKTKHIRRQKRKLPPNVTAQIFYLKNRCGYKDNPADEVKAIDVEPDGFSKALMELGSKL